eukprot:855019-Lingulodinium_polyedra.AAC.1
MTVDWSVVYFVLSYTPFQCTGMFCSALSRQTLQCTVIAQFKTMVFPAAQLSRACKDLNCA